MKRISKEDKLISIDILLVEDSPDDAVFIQEMLSEMILTVSNVRWVETLSDGIAWLNRKHIDLVLLDLNLPDSRGLETILKFKAQSSRTPFIVLTALGHEEMGRKAIQEGAQDYLCKTEINSNMLENALRFSLERHQLLVQLDNKKKQLEENHRRLLHIIEKNADGIIIIDPNGILKFLNPAAENLIRNPGVPSDKNNDLLARLANILHSYQAIPGNSWELNIAPENEKSIVLEVRMKEIDWDGETAYLATLRDISERKQLERSLLVEKERLDITLRSIADGVITTDTEGKIISINPSAIHMIGLQDKQNIPGKSIRHVIGSSKWESQLKSKCSYYDTCTIIVNGNEMIMEYACSPIIDGEKRITGYAFIMRDITLRKKMAEEMIKIQKLESLGIVAGRLAHEYDNVLTVILGNISITKKQVGADDEAMKLLEKAEQSALKARALTDQLHTFSRSGDFLHKNGSIIKLIYEVVDELLGSTKEHYNIQWQIGDDLWPVEFDRNQIYTAFWNIVKNAGESMPQGGDVLITLENEIIDEKDVIPLKPGNYVKISITDKGEGMPKETLAKIFDPFFTTKENSPGMGLATTFSIIRKHEGTIEVASEEGVGTTISIFLPASTLSRKKSKYTQVSEK